MLSIPFRRSIQSHASVPICLPHVFFTDIARICPGMRCGEQEDAHDFLFSLAWHNFQELRKDSCCPPPDSNALSRNSHVLLISPTVKTEPVTHTSGSAGPIHPTRESPSIVALVFVVGRNGTMARSNPSTVGRAPRTMVLSKSHPN
jgi:hypothetical protein